MLRIGLLFCLGIGLSACAEARFSRSGQMTVDATFTATGFTYSGGGKVHVFVKALDSGGKTMICAAYATDKLDGYNEIYNDRALDTASIAAGSTALVQGIGWMNRLSRIEDIQGASANCVTSAVDWAADHATGVRVLRASTTEPPDTARNSG